jgi:hypothetical protein
MTDLERAAMQNVRELREALKAIREAVEELAPPGSVPSEKHLTPEPMREAEAIIRGIQAIANPPRENSAPPLATTERGPSIMAGDQNTRSRAFTTPDGRTYLKKLPASITADQVLVHNAVPPTRVLGPRGFRAWTQPTTHPLAVEECGCGWAPELGVHYRVIGVPWRG